MISFIETKRPTLTYRIISLIITITFCSTFITPVPSYAQAVFLSELPAPGIMLPMSPGYTPALIRGLTILPDNPLEFDFIIDRGESGLDDEAIRGESLKMVKYFMAALTVPEDELWVNLSPYEKDRIIPESFGVTGMGRDLLAQDYVLKQLTASLMYPEDELGQKFWERVYTRARKLFGTTEIPVNTFNKVWIVPDKAVIFERGSTAFVAQSHLKVMLEEDYVALRENLGDKSRGMDQLEASDITATSQLSSQVVKDVLIPEIEKEVNEGKNFANLRQIYDAVILATWYKKNLKESLLGQVYVDQNKIKGIDIEDKNAKQKIYNQYVEAFKKGVYDFIKEDYDPVAQEIIPRRYFSGGARVVPGPEAYSEIEGRFERLPSEGRDRMMATAEKPSHDRLRIGLLENTDGATAEAAGIPVMGRDFAMLQETGTRNSQMYAWWIRDIAELAPRTARDVLAWKKTPEARGYIRQRKAQEVLEILLAPASFSSDLPRLLALNEARQGRLSRPEKRILRAFLEREDSAAIMGEINAEFVRADVAMLTNLPGDIKPEKLIEEVGPLARRRVVQLGTDGSGRTLAEAVLIALYEQGGEGAIARTYTDMLETQASYQDLGAENPSVTVQRAVERGSELAQAADIDRAMMTGGVNAVALLARVNEATRLRVVDIQRSIQERTLRDALVIAMSEQDDVARSLESEYRKMLGEREPDPNTTASEAVMYEKARGYSLSERAMLTQEAARARMKKIMDDSGVNVEAALALPLDSITSIAGLKNVASSTANSFDRQLADEGKRAAMHPDKVQSMETAVRLLKSLIEEINQQDTRLQDLRDEIASKEFEYEELSSSLAMPGEKNISEIKAALRALNREISALSEELRGIKIDRAMLTTIEEAKARFLKIIASGAMSTRSISIGAIDSWADLREHIRRAKDAIEEADLLGPSSGAMFDRRQRMDESIADLLEEVQAVDVAMLTEAEKAKLPPAFLANYDAGVVASEEDEQAIRFLLDAVAVELEDSVTTQKIELSELLSSWPEPGTQDEEKRGFLAQVRELQATYPTGLADYKKRGKTKLAIAEKDESPFKGMTPEQPNSDDFTDNKGGDFSKAVDRGLEAVNKTVFAMPAGGLGMRLGYSGRTKLEIPLDLVTMKSYLQRYIESILALQKKSNALPVNAERQDRIPFVLMSSEDNHDGMVEFISENGFFGMEGLSVIDAFREEVVFENGKLRIKNRETGEDKGELQQIVIFKQRSVPALKGYEGKFFLDPQNPFKLKTAPHGHVDIHMLMAQSKLGEAYNKAGKTHTTFFQDTNGQVFNSMLATLGNTVDKGYKMNFSVVKSGPDEKTGKVVRLNKTDGTSITKVVEYNQLAGVIKDAKEQGLDVSMDTFDAGNLNVYTLEQEAYATVLEDTDGLLQEMVNPKPGTLISRVEGMMQDISAELPGDQVGVTVYDPRFVFASTKNGLENQLTALAKAKLNKTEVFPEHIAATESTLWHENRRLLADAGVRVNVEGDARLAHEGDYEVQFGVDNKGKDVVRIMGLQEAEGRQVSHIKDRVRVQGVPYREGARINFSPAWAATPKEVTQKIKGGSISNHSVVEIDGENVHLTNVDVDGTLIIRTAPGVELSLSNYVFANKGWKSVALTPAEMASRDTPEILKMRGYRMVKEESTEIDLRDIAPGKYGINVEGQIVSQNTGEIIPNVIKQFSHDQAVADWKVKNTIKRKEVTWTLEEVLNKIIKEYDIRGYDGSGDPDKYPMQMDAKLLRAIGRALGTAEFYSAEHGQTVALKEGDTFVIAGDNGPKTQDVKSALFEGLRDVGINVIDLGVVNSGQLYSNVSQLEAQGGLYVTRSHVEVGTNGAKPNIGGITLYGGMLQGLKPYIADGKYRKVAERGKLLTEDPGQKSAMRSKASKMYNDMIRARFGGLAETLKKSGIKVAANLNGGSMVSKKALVQQMLGDDATLLKDENDTWSKKGLADPTRLDEDALGHPAANITKYSQDHPDEIVLNWDLDSDRISILWNGRLYLGDEMHYPIIEYMLTMDEYKDINKTVPMLFDSRMKSEVRQLIQKFGGKAGIHPKGHSKVKASMDLQLRQLAQTWAENEGGAIAQADDNAKKKAFLEAHPGFQIIQAEYSLHMFATNEKGEAFDDALLFALFWLEVFAKMKEKHSGGKADWNMADYIQHLYDDEGINPSKQLKEQRTPMTEEKASKWEIMRGVTKKVRDHFADRDDFEYVESWKTLPQGKDYTLIDIDGVFHLFTPIGEIFWGWSNTSEKVAFGTQSATGDDAEANNKKLAEIFVGMFESVRQEIMANNPGLELQEIADKETQAFRDMYGPEATANAPLVAAIREKYPTAEAALSDAAMLTKANTELDTPNEVFSVPVTRDRNTNVRLSSVGGYTLAWVQSNAAGYYLQAPSSIDLNIGLGEPSGNRVFLADGQPTSIYDASNELLMTVTIKGDAIEIKRGKSPINAKNINVEYRIRGEAVTTVYEAGVMDRVERIIEAARELDGFEGLSFDNLEPVMRELLDTKKLPHSVSWWGHMISGADKFIRPLYYEYGREEAEAHPPRRAFTEAMAIWATYLRSKDIPHSADMEEVVLEQSIYLLRQAHQGRDRAMMTRPLLKFNEIGQQIWVDGLTMEMLEPAGEFEKLVEEDGITGVTTNPPLVNAYMKDPRVQAEIREMKEAGRLDSEIYFETIKSLAQRVIAVFKAKGVKGKFSVELDPTKADDVEASVAEALEWTSIDPEYMMVKVAASEVGMKVIEEITARGGNVNATLIFSPEQYRKVAMAYVRGIAKAKDKGHDVSKIYSVASFFLDLFYIIDFI